MSCSIMTMENPHSLRRRPINSVNSADSRGFIPATGSSSSSNLGRVAIARAISNRLLFAYDNTDAGWSSR